MASSAPSPLEPIDRPEPLAERVAASLRDAIVAGRIEPGTHLSVPQLARHFAVSRTPAREALLILEREGLVGRGGGVGMRVLAGDVDKLVELLEMREVLEGLAARRAATRIDAVVRDAFRELLDRHVAVLREGRIDLHVEHDATFHRMILETAGSDLLLAQLERIERIASALNHALSAGQGFDPRVVEADHRTIVAALLAADANAAEQAARAHVRRATRFLKARRAAP